MLCVFYIVLVRLGGKYMVRDCSGEVYITSYYDALHGLSGNVSWGMRE